MNLLLSCWKVLHHPTKYRWMTLEAKDGSRLSGAVTDEFYKLMKEEINGR